MTATPSLMQLEHARGISIRDSSAELSIDFCPYFSPKRKGGRWLLFRTAVLVVRFRREKHNLKLTKNYVCRVEWD